MDITTSMKENSSAISITGEFNKERDEECEDVMHIDEISGIKLYGLADGQTGKKHCRIGGNKVLDAVFRFVADIGITQMAQYEYMDELQYEIIRVIRETINGLAVSECEVKDSYASTLVVFAYDELTNDYVIIHLGDGSIIGQRTSGDIVMISSPENGLTTDYTWLTTSRDAFNHLRIGFGNANCFSRIILITDGAKSIAQGKKIAERTKQIIRTGSQEDVVKLLLETPPRDDASCIIVDLCKSESKEIASLK